MAKADHVCQSVRAALPDADGHLYADGKTVRWRADSPMTLDVAQFEAHVTEAGEARESELGEEGGGGFSEAGGAFAFDALEFPLLWAHWSLPKLHRAIPARSKPLTVGAEGE